jgi:hypothetical protein
MLSIRDALGVFERGEHIGQPPAGRAPNARSPTESSAACGPTNDAERRARRRDKESARHSAHGR